MSKVDHNDEKDEFWDLDKLVPKKKSKLSPFATSSVAREYTVHTTNDTTDTKIATVDNAEERKLSFACMKGIAETEDKTYYPENSLIKCVTVKKYIEKYDFYDNFRKSAILYYDCPGEKCEFAQFYSYMPQYSQLTKPQKDYYLYWRSELRRGRYIKTDYSYLYLYVYEIINLPDIILPETGITLLCDLWREYRSDLPRIDMYFSIWVRDYCLVHELPCPFSKIKNFIFDVIRVADFKEYYFGDIGKATKDGVWAIIAYLSDYDWQRGLYSVIGKVTDSKEQSDKLDMYKTLFEGAMRVILPSIWAVCLNETTEREAVKISRSAFPNTLCTHSVKSKLEIEYYPISESAGIRESITAAVRYTENKLRALFGVKSRIAVKYIPTEYKELIDCYFAELIAKSEREAKKRALPEYEKLYEAPREKLSFSGADEIERLSWDTTFRLRDTDDSLELETENSIESSANPLTIEKNEEPVSDSIDAFGLSKLEIEYIKAILNGSEYCGALPEESIVEKINEAFSDGFGDIVLEHDGGSYVVIEDYKEEIIEWLKKF